MTRRARQLAAATLTVAAAGGAACCTILLVADGIATWQRSVPERAVVDDLRQRVQDDAAAAPRLQAEYDRQTVASLARDQRIRRLGYGLLACGAALVLGARWLVRLARSTPHPPRAVVQLHLRGAAAPQPAAPTGAPLPRAPGSDDLPPRVQAPTRAPPDLAPVLDPILARHGTQPAAAIPILNAIQAHYRYLPAAALQYVCEHSAISPAQLAGVASFYGRFRRQPVGEHVITVCHGTACHVAGAPLVTDELKRRLGIPAAGDTDPAGQFTVQAAPCLGCCTLAPVLQIDDVTHGHVRADAALALVARCQCRGDAADARADAPQPTVNGAPAGEIRIGLGSCCVANGSADVHAALTAALAAARVNVQVKRVGCVGMCHQTPFVEVLANGTSAPRAAAEGAGATTAGGSPGDATRRAPAGALYTLVTPAQVRDIVQRHFPSPRPLARVGGRLARTWRALRAPPHARPAPPRRVELRDPPVAAFLGPQVHIATEHCGDLDPLDLAEYEARDGFRGLARALHELRAPERIIAELRASGLRGRGGAGFPTWRKWQAVREAAGPDDGVSLKYVICNGDEGDPGAFMDRMLMESYPYRVLEGLAIAAYAVGAHDAICYIRAEYPLAVERLEAAIARCTAAGRLGERLLGSGPPLHVRVVQGAGAFVCGEETALIAALEGERGVPRLRPPYPAERGLHERPTLVNNVETLAVVPWILRHGGERFAALGTPGSRGTKVFALTGKVARGGLIEVPMGVTIRQVVDEIGGGVRPDDRGPRRFKAVQIGGPSGGCLPAELADTPIEYEALAARGAIIGSGGLVVLDNTDCMVDIARYFLAFTQDQSCGKCVPCRIGTRRMLEILDRICTGQGRADDLERLERLARDVGASSLCGLGKTAPNPVLTTLRHFRDEYEAHLAGRCPAGRCKALITYRITERCTGCTLCAQHCPVGAIPLRPYERHEIDASRCTRCDVCRARCPELAIEVV